MTVELQNNHSEQYIYIKLSVLLVFQVSMLILREHLIQCFNKLYIDT